MQRYLSDAFFTLHLATPVESAPAVFRDGSRDLPAAAPAAEEVAAADAGRRIVAEAPVSPQSAQLLRPLAKVGTLFRVDEVLHRRVLDIGPT